MKRNAKSKVFSTMMDMLCDYLLLFKDANNGISYPNESGQNRISPSKVDPPKNRPPESRPK